MKKEVERHQLEKFLSHDSIKIPIIRINNIETPDFELILPDSVISVEHTRIIYPLIKQKEEYKDKIIQEAQKRFALKYSEELYVLITFNKMQFDSGQKAFMNYVDEVFDVVEKIFLSNQDFEFDIDTKFSAKDVSKSIEKISVSNKMNFNHWQSFGGYFVPNFDSDSIKKQIRKKENNILKYPTKYRENWLLLISELGSQSSSGTLIINDFQGFVTTFDKVYMFGYMTKELSIIK